MCPHPWSTQNAQRACATSRMFGGNEERQSAGRVSSGPSSVRQYRCSEICRESLFVSPVLSPSRRSAPRGTSYLVPYVVGEAVVHVLPLHSPWPSLFSVGVLSLLFCGRTNPFPPLSISSMQGLRGTRYIAGKLRPLRLRCSHWLEGRARHVRDHFVYVSNPYDL